MSDLKIVGCKGENNNYELIALYNNSPVVRLGSPIEFSSSTKFTIFWPGVTEIEDLRECVKSTCPNDAYIEALYFFRNGMEKTPKLESNRFFDYEKDFLKDNESLCFLRYEIHTDQKANSYEQSRYSVWGNLSEPTQESIEVTDKETGIYATLSDFKDLLRKSLEGMVIKTLRPAISEEDILKLVNGLIETRETL